MGPLGGDVVVPEGRGVLVSTGARGDMIGGKRYSLHQLIRPCASILPDPAVAAGSSIRRFGVPSTKGAPKYNL